jgi:sec-independent protein translocase protein TatA
VVQFRNKEYAMGRVGLPELLIILAIVIVIFGANRLPGLGKGIGSAIKNFKDEMGGRDRDDDDKDKKDQNRKAS